MSVSQRPFSYGTCNSDIISFEFYKSASNYYSRNMNVNNVKMFPLRYIPFHDNHFNFTQRIWFKSQKTVSKSLYKSTSSVIGCIFSSCYCILWWFSGLCRAKGITKSAIRTRINKPQTKPNNTRELREREKCAIYTDVYYAMRMHVKNIIYNSALKSNGLNYMCFRKN